jgi:mono/diheme cytochrome c family protein
MNVRIQRYTSALSRLRKRGVPTPKDARRDGWWGGPPGPRGTPSSRPSAEAHAAGPSANPHSPLRSPCVQRAIGLCLPIALLLALASLTFAADQSQSGHGREIYQKWCTPCHGAGLGKPGTAAAAAHGIKPAVLEQRTNLTPKMIETAVRTGINFMPRFRKTEVSDADLAAIEAYLVHK